MDVNVSSPDLQTFSLAYMLLEQICIFVQDVPDTSCVNTLYAYIFLTHIDLDVSLIFYYFKLNTSQGSLIRGEPYHLRKFIE